MASSGDPQTVPNGHVKTTDDVQKQLNRACMLADFTSVRLNDHIQQTETAIDKVKRQKSQLAKKSPFVSPRTALQSVNSILSVTVPHSLSSLEELSLARSQLLAEGTDEPTGEQDGTSGGFEFLEFDVELHQGVRTLELQRGADIKQRITLFATQHRLPDRAHQTLLSFVCKYIEQLGAAVVRPFDGFDETDFEEDHGQTRDSEHSDGDDVSDPEHVRRHSFRRRSRTMGDGVPRTHWQDKPRPLSGPQSVSDASGETKSPLTGHSVFGHRRQSSQELSTEEPQDSDAPVVARPARSRQPSLGGEDTELRPVLDLHHEVEKHLIAERDKRRLSMQQQESQGQSSAAGSREELREMVLRGDFFVKYGRRGKPHARFVQVDPTEQYIMWGPTDDLSVDKSKKMAIESIVAQLLGAQTKNFTRFRAQDKQKIDAKSFSLVSHQGNYLDLVASSPTVRNMWVAYFRGTDDDEDEEDAAV